MHPMHSINSCGLGLIVSLLTKPSFRRLEENTHTKDHPKIIRLFSCSRKKMEEAYNRKINRDGTYRPFHGYTVVSMVVDDLSSIEQFIKESKYISKYYSPLPSSSYHVTVFNVWCHGQKLLPLQVEWLEQVEKRIQRSAQDAMNYKLKFPHRQPPPPTTSFNKFKADYIEFAKGEKSNSFVNMDEFLPVMSNIDRLCKTLHNKAYTAKIAQIEIDGCLVEFDKNTEEKYLSLREKIGKLVGHSDAR